MGTYTTPYKLYKPDGGELVDVETQLNRNLDWADDKFERTFDYQATDIQVISTSNLDKTTGCKYYKTYSNSIVYIDSAGVPRIDVRGLNPQFEDISFLNGWQNVTGVKSPVGYFKETDENLVLKYIRCIGNIRLNNFDAIVAGTVYTIGTVAAAAKPIVSRDWVGNCDTNNSIAKISVSFSTGNISVIRYGSAQSNGNASNQISLTNMEWAI